MPPIATLSECKGSSIHHASSDEYVANSSYPMYQFEIEDGDASSCDGESTRGPKPWCQFDCCHCAPTWFGCVPDYCRHIQGSAHLFVLAAYLLAAAKIAMSLFKAYGKLVETPQKKQPGETHQTIIDMFDALKWPWYFISALLTLPCLLYFYDTAKQFGEYRQKRREVEAQHKEMVEQYRHTLSVCDGFLKETIQKTIEIAELGFDLKMRMLERFLGHLARSWGCGMDSEAILEPLRKFVLNWSSVFAECSIDPVDAPRLVASKEGLDTCTSLGQIHEFLVAGSVDSKAQFIQNKKKHDEDMIQEEWALFEKLAGDGRMRTLSCFCISWIRMGFCAPADYVYDRYAKDGCFPKVLPCLICQTIFISWRHFFLILSLGAVILVLVADWRQCDCNGETLPTCHLIHTCVLLFCIGIMLVSFEEIDMVPQIMRHIQHLKHEKEQVAKKADTMVEQWQHAQACTDIWIYRTLPRLTLYSEVHDFLADTDIRQFQALIVSVNFELERLEHRLPPIKDWKNYGALKPKNKQDFRRTIIEIASKLSVQDITDELAIQLLPWEEDD